MYRLGACGYSLVVKHAERFGRHAVDAPFGVPVLIAYRDGEPAIVRPYQMDQLALAALDLQRLALASVCGVVPLCNRKRNMRFSQPLSADGRFAVIRTQLHAHAARAAATRGESNAEIIRTPPPRPSFSLADNPGHLSHLHRLPLPEKPPYERQNPSGCVIY